MGTHEPGIKLGATGQRVSRNLRELRGAIPVRELSSRLAQLGRPIAASGITKMEQGTRRVDADDLVALAVALDVTPNRLLLTETAENTRTLTLAPLIAGSERAVWRWASGERSAMHNLDVASESTAAHVRERRASFRTINRPHDPDTAIPVPDKIKHGDTIAPVVRATLDAIEETGLTREQVLAYIAEEVSLEPAFTVTATAGGDDGQR
ncbi:MAG: helix-turn-helix domain-containing protein [Nocardioidaceae bacterium]